jgi:hypothetical protein
MYRRGTEKKIELLLWIAFINGIQSLGVLCGSVFFLCTAEAQRKKLNYYFGLLSLTESKASVFSVALCFFFAPQRHREKK